MKLKTILGGSLLAAVLALGGVAGLAIHKESQEAQAEGEKIFTVLMDFDEAEGYSGFTLPQLYYKGEGIEGQEYATLHKLSSAEGNHMYTVNVVLPSSKSVDKIGFKFNQGETAKWTANYDLEPTSGESYGFVFDGWEGDNWKFKAMAAPSTGAPRIQYYGVGSPSVNFVPNYSDGTWKATLDIAEEGFDTTDNAQIYLAGWNHGALRASSASKYTNSYTLNSFQFKEYGKYDIFFYNSYEDGGVFEIKKYDEAESYIYYVTNSNAATVDHIYSWGGISQFGAFPGAAIASIEGVEEVTGNGVLRLQGGDASKLIYKIPVKIGYPGGDLSFKFDNGSDVESDSFELVPGAAYWWTGGANPNAAKGLEFLVEAEKVRNAVPAGDYQQYSVCGISKSEATRLLGLYEALEDGIPATYVDCSTVYTYKQDKSEGSEYVAYADIIARLRIIAGVAQDPKTVGTFSFMDTNNAAAIALIVVVSVLAITAVGYIVVRTRREHN